MTPPPTQDDPTSRMLDFVLNQPLQDNCVSMDCTDDCESISRLAERVVNGERLEDIMPEFEQHVRCWKDCREEFEALVAVLKAEKTVMSDE